MRPVFKAILFVIILGAAACHTPEVVSPYTGNEATYALLASSSYNISGTVTFRERKDGSIYTLIQLSGTSGDSKFPVHLHLGDITVQGADVALLLEPVTAQTGRSETFVTTLADESVLTYERLKALQACIKVHLSSTGAGKDVVIAAGNIGAATAATNLGGRIAGVGECKSE